MRKIFLAWCLFSITALSCHAKEINSLYIVRNAKIDGFTKELSSKLGNQKLQNNVLYSDTKDFYYFKVYKDGDNLNLFLVCDNNNLEKNFELVKSLNYKIYQLADKDLTKTYTKDFNSYISLNNINIGNVGATPKNEYNPYSKKLHNRVLRTASYKEDNIEFIAKKLKMNTKIKKYVDGFEFTIINQTGKGIVLKKVESGDFVGLTEIAKKAVLPSGVDFIPIYGIIAGAQTDLEKNKFTRPFPIDYVIKPNEKLRILALTKLMVEPIIDFTFEIDGKEKKIRFYTYK